MIQTTIIAVIITIVIFAVIATTTAQHILLNLANIFAMIVNKYLNPLNTKTMNIDTILRNTLFHIIGTELYYTINIDKPYKTDKGNTAYFINDSYTAFEYRANLIKAIKGKHKTIEAFTIVYKEN